jgi:hypothetical protein
LNRIEQLGRREDAAALSRELAPTLAMYRSFKPRLRAYGEVARADKMPAENAELCGLLKKLAAQIDGFDTDGAQATMKRLEHLQVPEICEAQMESLGAYMADMAMQKVMDTAADIAETIANLHGEETLL